jgi:NADH:ubiquinone oxidoreductase subunit B-like Fe-S oxidoreductase
MRVGYHSKTRTWAVISPMVIAHMAQALRRTYDATPDPKWVVAVRDCAANGGVFSGSYAVPAGANR